MKKYFSTEITKKQASDTGMAMVLIFLLIGLLTKEVIYFKIAIPVLIINMIVPMFYYPVAIIWFGLSHIMGTIASKVILSVVYFLIVFPVGILRKLLGKDALSLKEFKKGRNSVFKVRDHNFTNKDILYPY